MNWQSVLGNTGVIETHFALIPTYRLSPTDLVLIDSGAAAHPELFEDLDRLGLRVRAVLSTHLHPDHVANNRTLIDRYAAKIYAHPAEIRDTKPRYDLLRTDPLEEKWLWTEPDYPILPLTGDTVELDGARFALLPTPGHVEGHLAVVTPDGVCCLGDAIMSRGPLRAAMLPYMEYDVDLAAASMAKLKDTAFPFYIAAHRDVIPAADLPALADENIRKELELYDLLRRVIDRPMELEAAVTAFMRAAGVEREIMLRRVSMRSSAGTRITALVRAGELTLSGGLVSPERAATVR